MITPFCAGPMVRNIRRGGTIYAAYRAGKQFAKEFSRSSC